MNNVQSIRDYFAEEFKAERFTQDRNGGKTIEILGASFIADEDFIFGKPNLDYIEAELDWYRSQSLNVNDIYEDKPAPKAWQMTGDKHGNINSNYGYLIWSKQNFDQYNHVLNEIISNPDSRRATMVYTRPSIWLDYNKGGMSDFICTNTVNYYIRDGKVHCVVQMRSNDAWAGYRNDVAWQKYVLNKLTLDINSKLEATSETFGPILEAGDVHWQVSNLHMYERNFYLLDHYLNTGETHITKVEYDNLITS